MSSIKKAVIPAAGFGTRSLPATKVVPKELLPLVDKPAIQIIVEELLDAGIEEIIFVISRDKTQVVDHFKPHPALEAHLQARSQQTLLDKITSLQNRARYTTVFQEKPLGLGHAVLCAEEAVGDDWFLVCLPDDLIDHPVPAALQMVQSWETHGKPMLAVMEVPWENVSQYGVVKAQPLTPALGKVETVVEKPKRDVAPSNLAIIGRYLLPPSVFSFLKQVTPGAIGEIQLTDALHRLITDDLYAFQFEGDRYDIGNKLGYFEAILNYALNHPEIGPEALKMIKVLAQG